MALSPEQIAIIQDITKISSLSDLAARAATQTAEQNALTEADLTQWGKVGNKFSKLEGGRFGLKKDPAEARLEICNRIRNRFGYPSIDEYGQILSSDPVIFPSCTIKTTPGW